MLGTLSNGSDIQQSLHSGWSKLENSQPNVKSQYSSKSLAIVLPLIVVLLPSLQSSSQSQRNSPRYLCISLSCNSIYGNHPANANPPQSVFSDFRLLLSTKTASILLESNWNLVSERKPGRFQERLLFPFSQECSPA